MEKILGKHKILFLILLLLTLSLIPIGMLAASAAAGEENPGFNRFEVAGETSNDFIPPDLPTYDAKEDDDFIPGEVLAPADSWEQAQKIAAAYNLELESYAYGIAILAASNPKQAVYQSQMASPAAGIPELSLNWIHTVDGNDLAPLETLLLTNGSFRDDEEGLFKKTYDTGENDPLAAQTGSILMSEGMYYSGGEEERSPGFTGPYGDFAEAGMDHWQHEVMDNERAWDLTTGSGVTVAVIDTGINITHPAFAGRILANSYNAHTDQVGISYVQDDYGHGTHVSGIIAAAPTASSDISGVARDAQIMTIKSNIPANPGSLETATWLRGLNYAVDNGVDIVNMSFGRHYSNGPDVTERAVIARAVGQGVTIVVSAGNDNYAHAGYPAAYPEVITVSSLRMKPTGPGFDGSYSNFGPEIDISAPGTDILAPLRNGGYGHMTGTSMAAPNVAGAAALVKSLNPGFSPQQIRDRLNSTARQAGMLGGDLHYGSGIVSSYAALLGPWALHNAIYYFEDWRDPVTVLVAPGARLIEPARQVSGNQILTNWSTTKNGPSYNFDNLVTANMNLYASWTEAQDIGDWVREFPDPNFRHFVFRLLADLDGASRTDDSPMNTADTFLLGAIDILNLVDKGITNMTGLKHFPELTHLNLSPDWLGNGNRNNITSLDLSQNPKLQRLNAQNQVNLGNLDLANNPDLRYLNVWQGGLSALDLSNNPALEILIIGHGHKMSEVDVTNNPVLRELNIGWFSVYLTELDLSNNPALEVLLVANHNLTEIELKHNPLLSDIHLRNDNLADLDISGNPELTRLQIAENNLTSLDTSQNPKLFQLDASDNSLASINVSGSPELAILNLSDNQLTALDLANNPALGQLIIRNNQIAVLDLSNNVRLGTDTSLAPGDGWTYIFYGSLWADENMLTSLDISNTAPNWDDPAKAGTVRLNLSGNYIPTLDNVSGWQGRGLVLDDNFLFDPQHVSSPPVILTEALPDGKVGVTYKQGLVATGGGITWKISGGRLPEGLTLGSVGTLSGIPLEYGSFEFTVTASNEAGFAAARLTLAVSFASLDGVVTWITNAEELAAIGGVQSKDRYYALANDIHLDLEWVPIDGFRGLLDGRGHAIHNLYVLESSGRMNAGLFGTLSNADVTIKNLGVYIGPRGLTATSPSFFDAFAGGLVGIVENTSLTVINCYVEGNVLAARLGLSGTRGQAAGGLIGGAVYGSRITISTSSTAGNVTITRGNFNTAAGGLIGRGSDPLAISNSYATGNVVISGANPISGGLVGSGGITTIVNSYATGNVSAPGGYAGGIAGNIPRGSQNNSYRLSTQVVTGDVMNDLGTPLTDVQMRQQTSFEGWDFEDIWQIVPDSGYDYPQLRRVLLKPAFPFTVQAVNFNHSGYKFNGQRTLVSSFQVRANEEDMILANTQGLRLAYDNTVLQLINWDASAAIADPTAGGGFNDPVSEAGSVGVLGGLTVYNAISADKKTGYLSLAAGNSNATFACPLAEFVTLGEVRFAFREGKSAADLRDDSIWIMATDELNVLQQSTAVFLNTEQGVFYRYGNQKDGVHLSEWDELAKPAVIWELSNGVGVSGEIRSYNPDHPITIQLLKDGESVYTAKIPATTWDQVGSDYTLRQSFTCEDVAPGTYNLVITKAAHSRFTVMNVVVGDEDLDLSKDSRPEVQLMRLRCGDINDDGLINDADLTVLWRAGNYNKKAADADNERCDLNGDGLINDADLTVLWLAYNYNRGAIIID